MTQCLRHAVFTVLLLMLAGCSMNMGMPQTRDEFIAAYKPGGFMRSSEEFTVNRSVNAVVGDVAAYADKCLKVRVAYAGSYEHRQAATSTTYRPKIERVANGAILSVQEQYRDRQEKGAPPGGIFTLVAEVRAAGKNKTQVGIYHASRGKIADPLKEWIEGRERVCPSFERGW